MAGQDPVRKSKIASIKPEQMIGLVGDEDTLIGFLLAGCGDEGTKTAKPNFYITTNENNTQDIIEFVQCLVHRQDIAMAFIATDVADRIRPLMARHQSKLLEIPTKTMPFDPETDRFILAAKMMLSSNEDR